MRPTKIELLENQITNLKSKLNQVEEIVDKMGQFTHTGTKWTTRETIMFNRYGELKNIFK